jgi:putative transposase
VEKTTQSHPPQGQRSFTQDGQTETREAAEQAFDHCLEEFEPKCPKAMACLVKNRASPLAFYDDPAENWQPIRTVTPQLV